MSRLAISAGAGIVGGYLAGPTGAQIAFIGASLLTQAKESIKQPMVGDLRVQTASYNVPIYRAIGKCRLPGNIFWMSPKRPYTIKSGGKGIPTTEQIGLKCDLAIAICAGPITGVSRVWANNKLIIDAQPLKLKLLENQGSNYKDGQYFDVPLTGGTGSGAKARFTVIGGHVIDVYISESGSGYLKGDILSVNNSYLGGTGSGFSIEVKAFFTSGVAGPGKLYLGTDDQLQDPTMVAAIGADKVPAYRNIAYYVMTDLNLGTSGLVYNFNFEVLGATGV